MSPPRPSQQIADDLLCARDASAAALRRARESAASLIAAIARRRHAEDAHLAGKADMLAAHDAEAEARSAFDRSVAQAVEAALAIEALTFEAGDRRAA
jgi:hypothetical protein